MRAATMLSLLLVACYASHDVGDSDGGPRRDGSSFDAPTFDVLVIDAPIFDAPTIDAAVLDAPVLDAPIFDAPIFDAPIFDAPIFDAPTIDASVLDAARDSGRDAGVGCRAIRLVDEARVEWPSVDCGNITFPRVSPIFGTDGAFQLLVTESRSCFDRGPRLLTRTAIQGGETLRVGTEGVVGNAEGPGSIASNGGAFAVCSGTTLHTGSLVQPEPLLRVDMACANQALCSGLAHDGEGWGVGWRPGCDFSAEVSRAGINGGQREAAIAIDIQDSIASIAPSSDGFGALSISPRAISLFHWPRSAPGPTYTPLDANGPRAAALSAWPFVPGAWAVFSLENRMLRLRVVSALGETLIDQLHDIELPSYGPDYLRASSSPAGAAVVIGYTWEGGRIDAATRLMVFGRDEFPTGDLVGVNLEQDLGGPDVAMNGRSILVHRASPNLAATDVLLYECL